MRAVAVKLAVLMSVGSCALLSGCELIADFDRSKIVRDAGPAGDGSVMDGDAMIIDPPPDDEDGGEEPVDEDSGTDEDAGL
jgi:hypothetical protein